jgi:hypothetical protein
VEMVTLAILVGGMESFEGIRKREVTVCMRPGSTMRTECQYRALEGAWSGHGKSKC